MAKKPMPFGKLPKRPTGKMSEPGFGEGWSRAHNFDQVKGQPVRKANTPGV